VYKTYPHTLEEPRNKIHRKISSISGKELQRVNTNMFCRYTEGTQSGGQYYQHLLQHWWVFIKVSKGYFHCNNLPSIFTWPTLRSPTDVPKQKRQTELRCPFAWQPLLGQAANGPSFSVYNTAATYYDANALALCFDCRGDITILYVRMTSLLDQDSPMDRNHWLAIMNSVTNHRVR
jgi:hypothetical protein